MITQLDNQPTQSPALKNGGDTALEGILQIFVTRKKLFVALGVAAMTATLLHHHLFPSYTATAVLTTQNSDNNPLGSLAKGGAGLLLHGAADDPVEKYLADLKSHEFFSRAAGRIRSDAEYGELSSRLNPGQSKLHFLKRLVWEAPPVTSTEEYQKEVLTRRLSDITIIKKINSDSIAVRVKTRDPQVAVLLTNSLAAIAVDFLLEEDHRALREATEYVDQQLSDITGRLDGMNRGIVDYKKKNSILSPDSEKAQINTTIQLLQKDLQENQIKFHQNEKIIASLEAELKDDENQLFSRGAKGIRNSALAGNLRQRIEALKRKRSLVLSNGFGDDSVQIAAVNEEIDRTAQQLKQLLYSTESGGDPSSSSIVEDREGSGRRIAELKRDNTVIQARVDTVRSTLAKYKKSFEYLPEGEETLLDLRKKGEMEYGMFQELKRKLLELEVQKITVRSKVRINESASLAATPSNMRAIPKMGIALLVSLIVGLLLSFILEEVNLTVRRRSEVERQNLSLLGGIPEVERPWWPTFRARLKGDEGLSYHFDFDENPDSAATRAFKLIGSKLMDAVRPDGEPVKTISILSPGRGEGKTFLAYCLAVFAARQGKKVLLIDCHFRHPKLSDLHQIDESPGLSSMMGSDPAARRRMIRSIAKNIDFIPAGRFGSNPTELIGQEKFAQLIQTCREHYDRIFIDTPPVVSAPDATVIATLTDASVLVVSHRKTRREDLAISAARIQDIPDIQLFTIFNRVSTTTEHLDIYLKSGRARVSRRIGEAGKQEKKAA